MPILAKSAPLDTLGLPPGDWVVHFHVEEDAISYEVSPSLPPAPVLTDPVIRERSPGFIEKYGGSMKKIEDLSDEWLTHINEKHLR